MFRLTHSPTHPHTRLRAAFTLIELLVVIAIISILAALLLPTLGRSQESVRATRCLGNLHQIGIALQLYVKENNNSLDYMSDKNLTKTYTLSNPDIVLFNFHVNLMDL